MKFTVKSFFGYLIAAMLFLSLNGNFSIQAADLRPGDRAPELSLPDANGTSYTLSSFRGNIVLLYFWDSHEPNTEILAPNLNVLYEKYRQVQFSGAQGFKIFAVSLDEDKSTWLNQINRYQLKATHVLDIYGQMPNLYGFRQVPTWYLIDEAGTIIGINSGMAELDRTLAARAIAWNPVAATPTPATYNGGMVSTPTVRTIPMSDMMLMSDGQAQKERSGAITLQQNTLTTLPANTIENGSKPSVFGIETTPPPTGNPILPQKTYTKGPHYKIQLGAYRFLNSADFENVRTVSEVFAEPAADNSGLQRIVMGDFKEKHEAVAALAKVQAMGYPDAFVLLYDTEKRIRALAKDEVSKIAKSKGIILPTPATAATSTANTLVTVADTKEQTNTPATFSTQSQQMPLSVHNAKTLNAAKIEDNYFPTIADTELKEKTSLNAAPLPGTTAATNIYTPNGTYTATDAQTYSYTPRANENLNMANRVETYSTTTQTAPSGIGVGTTIPTYISMPKSATNVYTPANKSGVSTPVGFSTNGTTTPSGSINGLQYGQMSESYSRDGWSNSGQWQSVGSGSMTTTQQNTGWQPVNSSTTTNNGGVWIPEQISVFTEPNRPSNTSPATNTAKSGTYYDDSNFDWYPTNNKGPAQTNPSGNTKPTTYNSSGTPSSPSSNTTTTTKPTNANTPPTTLTPPTTNIPPTTNAKPNTTEGPNSNNNYLDNYVDSYMKDFEPKASKKLKAKNKRDKEEKENKKKEEDKKKKNKKGNKKSSWLDR